MMTKICLRTLAKNNNGKTTQITILPRNISNKTKRHLVRRGVAGYRGGADGMAWEATAGNWRRRRAAALGFGGLLLVRFAAGAAEL